MDGTATGSRWTAQEECTWSGLDGTWVEEGVGPSFLGSLDPAESGLV